MRDINPLNIIFAVIIIIMILIWLTATICLKANSEPEYLSGIDHKFIIIQTQKDFDREVLPLLQRGFEINQMDASGAGFTSWTCFYLIKKR